MLFHVSLVFLALGRYDHAIIPGSPVTIDRGRPGTIDHDLPRYGMIPFHQSHHRLNSYLADSETNL